LARNAETLVRALACAVQLTAQQLLRCVVV
jgi:hypothetical protein